MWPTLSKFQILLLLVLVYSCNSKMTADLAAHKSEFALGSAYQLTTVDNERIFGELIATYDHRAWWWEPDDRITYAFFNVINFNQDWQRDQSIRFIANDAIKSIQLKDNSKTSYRNHLRQHGIVFRGMPLGGNLKILMGNEGYHREESGKGDFAWDFDVEPAKTDSAQTREIPNKDFAIYGATIRSPVKGWVAERESGQQDQDPGVLDLSAANNYLGLRLNGAYYAYFLHHPPHTLDSFNINDPITEGQALGVVGNSGVTLRPHLHMTMMYLDRSRDKRRLWSIPAEFFGQYSPDEKSAKYFVPKTGEIYRGISQSSPK